MIRLVSHWNVWNLNVGKVDIHSPNSSIFLLKRFFNFFSCRIFIVIPENKRLIRSRSGPGTKKTNFLTKLNNMHLIWGHLTCVFLFATLFVCNLFCQVAKKWIPYNNLAAVAKIIPSNDNKMTSIRAQSNNRRTT